MKKRFNSHDSNGIVVKDGRDVFGREFVRCVGNQEARFTNSTVTDDNASKLLKPKLVSERSRSGMWIV